MDLSRVREGESLAPSPGPSCPLQESLPCDRGPSPSRHSSGALCGGFTPPLAVLLLRRGLWEPFPCRDWRLREMPHSCQEAQRKKTKEVQHCWKLLVYWFHPFPTAPGFWQPHTNFAEKDLHSPLQGCDSFVVREFTKLSAGSDAVSGSNRDVDAGAHTC